MVLATKERITARRQVATDRFIRSTYPILWLDFSKNDGIDLFSDDAYGYAELVTGALWTPQGRIFTNATDIIDGSPSTALDPGTGGFSIEAWVKTDTVAATVARVVSKQSAAWYFLRRSTTTWTIDWKDSAANLLTITSTANMAVVNKWTHLFAVRDGINGYLYIDGVLNNSGSTVGLNNINVGAANFRIGSYDGASEAFSGVIGEVRIYNRALTILEAQRNYLATKWRYK